MTRLLPLMVLIVCNNALGFDSPQALQDAFVAAMRANDVEGLAACYTADATNFTPTIMAGIGPDSVRASWGVFFERYQITSADLTDQQMLVSGDLAVAWGLFRMMAKPVGGGETIELNGRFMDVARNFDGNWLYIADHASMPLPAAEE